MNQKKTSNTSSIRTWPHMSFGRLPDKLKSEKIFRPVVAKKIPNPEIVISDLKNGRKIHNTLQANTNQNQSYVCMVATNHGS